MAEMTTSSNSIFVVLVCNFVSGILSFFLPLPGMLLLPMFGSFCVML